MEKPFSAYKGSEPFTFVCYAHRDSEVVYQDIALLHKKNVNIWYDEGIPAGSSWRSEIAAAISGANQLLFFISARSLESSHCMREVRFALDNDIDILPVYLENCTLPAELALALSGVHALYREKDDLYEKHLEDSSKGVSASTPIPLRQKRKEAAVPPGLLGLFALTLFAGLVWFGIQLAEFLFPEISPSPWVGQTLIFVLVICIPASLIFAWVYGLLRSPSENALYTEHKQHASPSNGKNHAEQDAELTIPEDKSIAVLPLANLSPVAENAYFCDGVHDEILNQLSKISDIRVVSRAATLQYRDTSSSIRKIASALNVSQVMEGSVRYADNRVRIHTQLIEASGDTQLWSEIYESELNDIFRIQSDVALNAASAMQARMAPDEVARIEQTPTDNMEAYTLFLKAITRENQESSRITGEKDGWIESGLRDLDQAIKLDPAFARGYAQLAWLQVLKRYTVAFDIEQSEQLLASAKSNAEKALLIDPSIVYAYSVLAFVAFERHLWTDWEELENKCAALPDAKSGILLNYAERLGRLGRFDEALDVIDRSIGLDPVRAHNREYATYYSVLGRGYDAALEAAERYRHAGGDEGAYHLYRALSYYFNGDSENAQSELNSISTDLSSAHLNCPIFCAFLHSRLLGKELAEEYVLKQKSPVAREFADFGRALGNRDFDHAFRNLERYLKGGHVVSNLGEILDEIKKDARWKMIDDYLATPKPAVKLR